MRAGTREWRAIFWQEHCACWVDQTLLPHKFSVIRSQNPEVLALAIESMQVRGAPTIGATAAFGLALAYHRDRSRFETYWLARFRRTRPTAINLFHACDSMQAVASGNPDARVMIQAAQEYADQEVSSNRRIGETMAELLAVGERRILTHCNAGWLAAVDWGTALSGIYTLARAGESPFVWIDETRPRLQGARLTAWELMQEGIPCRLQADSAAAWMMARGEVDAVVVGADRIAANGDVANKVGTYMLSLAAGAHGIPFYVVAPRSSFDSSCEAGNAIPIEQRPAEEVLQISGLQESGEEARIRISMAGLRANNPAFDVTPAENITAIVSEQGIWRTTDIA